MTPEQLDAPLTDDRLATMISDLAHTGELSMLYRMEIADAITHLRTALSASSARKAAAVAAQVAAERERCAKVADASAQSDLDYADKYPDEAGRYERTAHRAKTIAAVIRGQS